MPVTAVGVEIHTPHLVAVYCWGMQQSIDVSRLSTKSLLICIEPQRDVTGHNSIYPQWLRANCTAFFREPRGVCHGGNKSYIVLVKAVADFKT